MDTIGKMLQVVQALAGSPLFQVIALIAILVGVACIAFDAGREYGNPNPPNPDPRVREWAEEDEDEDEQ